MRVKKKLTRQENNINMDCPSCHYIKENCRCRERKLTRQDTIRVIFAMLDVFFHGNFKKTDTWIRTYNPLLGNQRPWDMINEGREKKLFKFVKNAIEENKL